MRWAGLRGFRDAKLGMSYERSRMGRVTTERVHREVKREHSGSKKACVKQYSRVKTSEEGEQCAFISYACIRSVAHVAREENNAFKTCKLCIWGSLVISAVLK